MKEAVIQQRMLFLPENINFIPRIMHTDFLHMYMHTSYHPKQNFSEHM